MKIGFAELDRLCSVGGGLRRTLAQLRRLNHDGARFTSMPQLLSALADSMNAKRLAIADLDRLLNGPQGLALLSPALTRGWPATAAARAYEQVQQHSDAHGGRCSTASDLLDTLGKQGWVFGTSSAGAEGQAAAEAELLVALETCQREEEEAARHKEAELLSYLAGSSLFQAGQASGRVDVPVSAEELGRLLACGDGDLLTAIAHCRALEDQELSFGSAAELLVVLEAEAVVH